MTQKVTLTTAWQEIANADAFFASFDVDSGEVQYAFGDAAPSEPNYHKVYEDLILSGSMPSGLWARLGDASDVASVAVDTWDGSMGIGSGLNLINVAVSVVAIRG